LLSEKLTVGCLSQSPRNGCHAALLGERVENQQQIEVEPTHSSSSSSDASGSRACQSHSHPITNGLAGIAAIISIIAIMRAFDPPD